MKKIIALLLSLALILSFAACAKDKKEEATVKKDVNVYVLSGPTGVGALNLWEEAELGTSQHNYKFTLTAANDEIIAAVSNGSADIAAVATNMASSLYNKTEGGVTVLAVNTTGVLSILSNGNSETEQALPQSLADLKGRTIYSPGQGANPEYILRYVLSGNGLDLENDITIKFVTDGSELTTVWATDPTALIMAPQPVATTLALKQNAVKLFDMTEEWSKISTDSSLMMGCVIVRNEFLKENKEVVNTFLNEYKASIEKAQSDVENTAKLAEKRGIIPSAAVAQKAIPQCGLTFVSGEEMKKDLGGYLNVMFNANPKSVGGKLPLDDFYYLEK